MMHRTRVAFALSIGIACFAGPALAGAGNSVEGTWEVEFSCKGTTNLAPSSRKGTLVLPIHEIAGEDLQAGGPDTGAMSGFVLFESAKPERVRIALVGCSAHILNSIVLEASGKVTPEKARLKGALLFLNVAGESIEECKAKLVRTDTGSPTVESCV